MATGLVAQSGLAPRGNRTWTANRGFTLTTTVWVIVWVHYRTANGRSPAHVTLSASLTDLYVLVVDVAYLTDGSHAVYRNVSQLAGRQSQQVRMLSSLAIS